MIAGRNISTVPTFTTTVIAAFTTPAWTSSNTPSQSGTSEVTSVTLGAGCSTVGYICAACVTPNNSVYPTHNQILTGLDENNDDADGFSCVDNPTADASVTVSITGLTASTQYKCYMQCFNDYPVWGGYISYDRTTTNPISSVTVTTADDTDSDDDTASFLQAVFALIMMLFI